MISLIPSTSPFYRENLSWYLHFFQYLLSQINIFMSFCTPELNILFLKCTFLLLDSRKSTVTLLSVHILIFCLR